MGFQWINLAMYFTNITFVLNLIRMTPFLNAILYLCNISAFLGTLMLLTLNPQFPYVEFKNMIPMSLGLFNFILIAVHVIPLYLFGYRQTLRETFAPRVIAGAGAVFLMYFLVFKQKLKQFYGLEVETQGKLSLCFFLLYWGVHVFYFLE